MLTIGIDLAAEAKGTALAAIRWSGLHATLETLTIGISDADIVAASRGAASVGIDCPFGWPTEFVDFLTAHATGSAPPRGLTGIAWRRRLAYRETDRVTRDAIGKWPLSVSTDRLGLTAMHCVELLERFERNGDTVLRSGEGRFAEVYPAGALKIWGIDPTGPKSDPSSLAGAIRNLKVAAPWLRITDTDVGKMLSSHDGFDAVIAALNARAHALGQTARPSEDQLVAARAEGWIAFPTMSAMALID